MYRLHLILFVIAGTAYAVELSRNIPHGEYENHVHRTEHLENARKELQEYFNEWVHQKFQASLKARMSVTPAPNPPIPSPYLRWLDNPQGATEDASTVSQSSRANDYASQTNQETPKSNEYSQFHLYHLHRQNGDQASWTHFGRPQKFSYSYVHKNQPPTCKYPPCLDSPPSPKPVQPAYTQYQQDQPVYSHYQTQPIYQIYNPYQGSYEIYNPYQVATPAYSYQGTQGGYPWVPVSYQKPTEAPLPTRPIYPSMNNGVPTSYPSYPSAGPQYVSNPIVDVPPILNMPGIQQQPSVPVPLTTTESTPLPDKDPTAEDGEALDVNAASTEQVPLNTTTSSTTTVSTWLPDENSTTENEEEAVGVFAELTVPVPMTTESQESLLSTDLPNSDADKLIPGVLQVAEEMVDEDATISNEVLGNHEDSLNEVPTTVSSLPTSSPADDMDTSLMVTQYGVLPTAVSTGNTMYSQEFTTGGLTTSDSYSIAETPTEVPTHTSYSTESTFAELTTPNANIPEYSAVPGQEIITAESLSPIGQEYTTFTYSKIPEVTTTSGVKGSTHEETTTPYAVETTGTQAEGGADVISTITETVPTSLNPSSETTFPITPNVIDATTQYDINKVTISDHPSTTMNTGEEPFEVYTTTEEEKIVTDHPYGGTTDINHTMKTTFADLGTTQPPEETTTYVTNSPIIVTEKISVRHAIEETAFASSTIPKKIKGIVRREDSKAKKQPEKQPSASEMMSDSANMISEDFEDSAREDLVAKVSVEAFGECFLKHLTQEVSKELRGGQLSPEDEANLKEVFGDMWFRVHDEAFNGIPVAFTKPDQVIATRALQYFFNGTPLARRLGKRAEYIGKSVRTKREVKKSGLEPWQEVLLRSILARQQLSDAEAEGERYRVVLKAIEEQLHEPRGGEYDYADESAVGETTQVNRNEEYDPFDSEYYYDDLEDEDTSRI